MRKYIHRRYNRNTDADPMDVNMRSVFFKNTTPKKSQDSNSSNTKNQLMSQKDIGETPPSEIMPKSLELFTNSEKFDEKIHDLKKQIDNEIKVYDKVHRQLQEKSYSVKVAKETLLEQQKELSRTISTKSQEFEKRNLEIIGEISSKMAHDIRNPLTVIKAQVELMKIRYAKQEDEIMSISLNRMENAIAKITNQINDVLEFIRNPVLELKICDLREMLQNIVDEMVIPHTIQLKLPVNSGIVICDEIKIKTIFSNIILNAIQAVDNVGEISIRIIERLEDFAIEIEDSGPGIPETHLETIFEPLFTTKHNGTGLGLASCKQIINLHGGSIHATNNPTIFSITLPKRPKIRNNK